jgi:anaerobic magnesium-protoporphyrin IX monomethyl ester cyclase
MRICLVTPPSPFLLDERVFVSLGVLKVAASLERAGHEVDVLDLSGVKDYETATAAYVDSHPAVYQYGITATTPQMPAAVKIRAQIPSNIVYLGGPHATLVHAAYRNEVKRGIAEGRAAKAMEKLQTIFGVLVVGDGEGAIHLALNARRGQIIDADNPATELFMSHQSFTDSPWAARHLVDMDSYHYEIEGHKATSIVAQLGCPFGCNFCGGRLSPMLRKIRLRSTESILAELAFLYETYGYTGFMFYDDELNVNPKLIELLRGIYELQVRLRVTFRLRGFVKAELFTTEQAEWMYIAGFRWLLCGFESGSETILRNIEKKATKADNTRMLVTAHASGIKVKALMSLGHPGESRETIRDTRHWLLEERPDDFDATVITVYPGTPYYDSALETAAGEWCFTTRGDNLYHQDLDFTVEQAFYKGIPGEYRSFVWTDFLSSKELVQERDGLEEEVRRVLHLPYPGQQTQFDQSMGQVNL